ncbi:hypothetical protein [Allosphingosinicella vermicomposti]|uniref:hypothetical protein n=1 Tax=Allosphingosinicella vermicomposti TaxID=614671 RepID=UPI000D0E6CFC|nr:hypothetical protein [Allosphingosinicella vermicomposti]
MDSGGFSWSLITIIGPILLALVILWAMLRNRKASRRDVDRTEQATRDLYKAEDAKLDDEKL